MQREPLLTPTLYTPPPTPQADLFTKAVMLGNGVMAIASGLLGSWLVQGLGLGPVAPFDAAILVRHLPLSALAASLCMHWHTQRTPCCMPALHRQRQGQ